MKVGVCVETLEQAFLAQELGVDRIELCANLLQGGLTPSIAAIESAVQRLPLKVWENEPLSVQGPSGAAVKHALPLLDS